MGVSPVVDAEGRNTLLSIFDRMTGETPILLMKAKHYRPACRKIIV